MTSEASILVILNQQVTQLSEIPTKTSPLPSATSHANSRTPLFTPAHHQPLLHFPLPNPVFYKFHRLSFAPQLETVETNNPPLHTILSKSVCGVY